jgi:hypothetical protein
MTLPGRPEKGRVMTKDRGNLDATLQQQLDAFKKEFIATVPPQVSAAIFGNIEELVRSGVSGRSLKAGDHAPDFSLPNIRGELVALADLLARGPVVVVFYRGVW